MHNIYVKDLIEKFNGHLIFGNENEVLDNFSKDTRDIKKGEIYVGIKGETFDGSTLYIEALEKGAKGCILNNNVNIESDIILKYKDRFIVTVGDTVKLLQDLAAYKRSLYDIPVIAITGSVGKTSTKDIIASVVSEKYHTLKTDGNYNNEIGLPLTILRLKDHEAIVLEMGMNHFGEISLLSKIAKPTIGVITNVGTAHIGILGSRENILKAKLELLDGLEGKLVINNDNDLLNKWYLENNNKDNIITYGINKNSTYMAYNIKENEDSSEYKINLNDYNYDMKINVPGTHFISNSLAAITVGNILNIPMDKIKKGIENFELTKNRMEIENISNITFINDFYNANIDSMKAALNYLNKVNGRKVAVLGDMFELGEFSEKLHTDLGNIIIENNIDIVLLVGKDTKYTYNILKDKYDSDKLYYFTNLDDLKNNILNILLPNDKVLLKASYGMNFFELYNFIKNNI